METKPVLSFEFDILKFEDETIMKGYCGNVTVVLPHGARYKVFFYDPTRLSQDLESEGYVADPGMIVIQEVSIQNMERAVYELWLGGYFESMKEFEG